tara:strand:+ start:3953 stop:4339 length:387 start_codon:yes stop_codon:yes gene_type:complete
MAWGDSVRGLASELKKLNDEFVETKTKFGMLKERVVENLDQFKAIVEKTAEKMEQMEKEHIRERADLNAKIDSLSARLDSLSEQALHAAVHEAADRIARERLENRERSINDSPGTDQIDAPGPPEGRH